MSTPVVREDYVKIGMRYASDKMVNTIDRLAPLATTDIDVLSNHCYSAVMLEDLPCLSPSSQTTRPSGRA